MERMFADETPSSMKRRSTLAMLRSPTDYSRIQKIMNEEIKAEKEKSGKKDEEIYNKYTASAYVVIYISHLIKEFDALQMEVKGEKEEIVFAIDGVSIYMAKKKKVNPSPSTLYKNEYLDSNKFNLHKIKPGKVTMSVIPVKAIARIEKAMYDDKKFYMWYTDIQGRTARIDVEMLDASATLDVIARIRFISKTVKCKDLIFFNLK